MPVRVRGARAQAIPAHSDVAVDPSMMGVDEMNPGEEGAEQAAYAVDGAVQDAAQAARTVATDAAAGMQTAATAIADHAEKANQDGARSASSAIDGAADAFGAARERLNAMSESLPPAGQELFRPFQAGSDAFGKGLQSSYTSAMEGMAEFNSKAIAAWRSNAESMIRHWQGLAGVKSLSEAVALNAEHTRQQLEAVTAQTRELSSLATRIVRDAADPLKMAGR